jgi:hypothetical protein
MASSEMTYTVAQLGVTEEEGHFPAFRADFERRTFSVRRVPPDCCLPGVLSHSDPGAKPSLPLEVPVLARLLSAVGLLLAVACGAPPRLEPVPSRPDAGIPNPPTLAGDAGTGPIEEGPRVPARQAELEWVTQFGGDVVCGTLHETTGYFGVGVHVQAIDFSHPQAPVEGGESAPLSGLVRDVAAAPPYVLAAVEAGGMVVLKPGPGRSQPLGEISRWQPRDGAPVTQVEVLGHHALIAAGDKLHIVSLQVPSAPMLVTSHQARRTIGRVHASGDRAYLAYSERPGQQGEVEVVQFTPAMNPSRAGMLLLEESAGPTSVAELDVAEPARAVLTRILSMAVTAMSATSEGVYLSEAGAGLTRWTWTGEEVQLVRLSESERPYGMVADGRVAVLFGAQGARVYSLADAAATPVELPSLARGAVTLGLIGDRLIAGARRGIDAYVLPVTTTAVPTASTQAIVERFTVSERLILSPLDSGLTLMGPDLVWGVTFAEQGQGMPEVALVSQQRDLIFGIARKDEGSMVEVWSLPPPGGVGLYGGILEIYPEPILSGAVSGDLLVFGSQTGLTTHSYFNQQITPAIDVEMTAKPVRSIELIDGFVLASSGEQLWVYSLNPHGHLERVQWGHADAGLTRTSQGVVLASSGGKLAVFDPSDGAYPEPSKPLATVSLLSDGGARDAVEHQGLIYVALGNGGVGVYRLTVSR